MNRQRQTKSSTPEPPRIRADRRRQSHRQPGRDGFTLLELLVVIAIIAVLGAILFPVFARAQLRSKNAVCVSNLRQLGIALQGYAEDYDDRMPVGLDVFWGDMEHVPIYGAKYLHTVLADRTTPELWHCPADQGFRWWNIDFTEPIIDYAPSCYQTRGQSYDYNLLLAWDYAHRRVAPIPVSSVKEPARIALLKDSHFGWHDGNHPLNPRQRDIDVLPAWNAIYLDGHVERKTLDWWRGYSVDTRTWWYRDNNPRL